MLRCQSGEAGALPAADAGAGPDEVSADDAEAMYDPSTRRTMQKIPLLSVRAGPRDGAAWVERLREEYGALIQYISMNKENDNDWFTLESDREGRMYGRHLCVMKPMQGLRASSFFVSGAAGEDRACVVPPPSPTAVALWQVDRKVLVLLQPAQVRV